MSTFGIKILYTKEEPNSCPPNISQLQFTSKVYHTYIQFQTRGMENIVYWQKIPNNVTIKQHSKCISIAIFPTSSMIPSTRLIGVVKGAMNKISCKCVF